MRRGVRLAVGFIAAIAIVAALSILVGSLPSGTRTGSLAIRAAAGLSIGIVFVALVRRLLRALTEPPPPAPSTVDARSADVVYECSVCGTRVRLEVAATTKAPKHCGEEMEAKIG